MQPDSSDAPAYPDESSAKIPKAPCGTVKRAFRAAFPHTLPILAGFLFLGFAYGLLMRTKGFSFLYPMCMAMTIFGGSLEYVTVSMLLSAFAPLETFLMALLIQARHLFYGLSLLGKYAGTGWKKPLLIFGLCDETFSITCSADVPPEVDRGWFYLWVTVLDWCYWVAGAALGGLLGGLFPFDTKGLDFVMTAHLRGQPFEGETALVEPDWHCRRHDCVYAAGADDVIAVTSKARYFLYRIH